MKSQQQKKEILPRRRVLKILAATSAAGLAVAASRITGQPGEKQPPVYTWRGKALGADSAILICHPNPSEALSDGEQSLPLTMLPQFKEEVGRIAAAMNRELI